MIPNFHCLFTIYLLVLFKITSAPNTPGIHPHNVNNKIIIKEPHPLSIIDSGGKIIANKTLNIFI